MSVQVVKKGRLPAEDPFAGSCYHCKTQIRCLRADRDWQEGDPRDQRDPGYLKVACPTCSSIIQCYPSRGT